MEYRIDDKELIEKLGRVSTEAVENALKQACLLVENEAKLNCPIDDGVLVGSIQSEVEGNVGRVGTNVEYAPYVEFGTGIWAGTSEYGSEYLGTGRETPWSYQDAEGQWHTTIGQKPQPFLYPALMNNRENINRIFKEKIDEVIKND